MSGVFEISTGEAIFIPAGLQSTVLRLWEALEQEPMLAATSEDQRQEARKAVERAIFSEVHTYSWVLECSNYYFDAIFADLYGGTVPQHRGRCIKGLGAAAAHWEALRGG